MQAPGVAVFDCYATWCGPCKVVAPKVVELSNTYPAAKFYKIDVDELQKRTSTLFTVSDIEFILIHSFHSCRRAGCESDAHFPGV